ncbi:hypothetical protein D9M68_781840 [compost metagenome]
MVHDVLEHLQPVARVDIGEGHQLSSFRLGEGLEFRELRFFIRRPHVGEHQAAALKRRIGALAHAFLQLAALGLARGFQQGAVHIPLPAVVATTDAVFLNDAELQRRPTVGAMTMQHADTTTTISEGDQILAKDANRFGQLTQLF